MDLTVELLLNKRDYDAQAFTRKIIAIFEDRLTKAVQMQYKTERDIKWFKLERFTAIEGYVVVHGDIEVRVGDVLNTANGPVVVDEKNQKYATNTVKYVLNSKVLQGGTVEAIFQHMEFVSSLAREASDTQLVEILKSGAINSTDLVGNPALTQVMEKITRPTTFETFDTGPLTEDQYRTLRLCAKLGKTEKAH
jgi:hypothetical protein